MSKMRIRKGDRVHVITGKDKGKEGKEFDHFLICIRNMMANGGIIQRC